MKKRILSLLAALAMLLSLAPQITLVASAETISGYCGAEGDGSNVSWSINTDTGVMTISGTGAMADFGDFDGDGSDGPSPGWRFHYNEISKVHTLVVEEGVTSIGNYAFQWYNNIKTIHLPASLTRLGEGSFKIDDEASYSKRSVYVTSLSAWLGLEKVNNYGSDFGLYYSGYDLYVGGSLLTDLSIPASLTAIPAGAFRGCSSVTQVWIPGSVTEIGSRAFDSCYGIKDVLWASADLTGVSIATGNSSLTGAQHVHYSVSDPAAHWQLQSACTGLYACSCGYERVDAAAALGHDFGAWTQTAAPSCTDEGSESRTCSRCGEVETQAIAALGHDYVGVVTAPTYSSGGFTTYTCSRCGDSYVGDEVPALLGPNGACGENGDNVIWSLNPETGILTISGSGNMADYPSTGTMTQPWYAYADQILGVVIAEGVTYVGAASFFNFYSNLASVELASSVSCIGVDAFYGCRALTQIDIPDGVTQINESAFTWCTSLAQATLPSTLTSLGAYAFNNTALTSVTLPDGITAIGAYTFSTCSALTEITLPAGLTSIGNSAFYGCSALEDVFFDGTPAQWSAIEIGTDNEPLLNASIHTFVRGVCGAQGDNLTWVLDTGTGVLTISGSGDMKDHRGGGDLPPWFDYADAITTVILEDGVTSVGDKAFVSLTALASVTIPEGVTRIGKSSFAASTTARGTLTDIVFPNSLETIGDFAFASQGLRNVTIGTGLRSVGRYAFQYCYGLGGGNIYISDLAAWCSIEYDNKDASPCLYSGHLYLNGELLTAVTIPDGVTRIGDYAFCGRNITSVTIPAGVTSIGAYVFDHCEALKSVSFPAGLTSIGDYAFWATGVTDFGLPDSITSIGAYAFGWSRFTSFTIPAGVTELSEGLFTNCTSLASITIPEGVTRIGAGAFSFSYALTEITIPDSVTVVEDNAFQYCSSLSHVTIGSGLTTVNGSAFSNCSNLASFTVSADNPSLSSEEGVLFNKDKTLLIRYPIAKQDAAYTVPTSVTEIGTYAFANCENLTSVTLPDGVTEIGTYAFHYCDSLTSVNLPDGVTEIGTYAFYYCTSLAGISIPVGVTKINDYAFYSCYAIRELTIPENVTEIGLYAFHDCNLSGLILPASVSKVWLGAFTQYPVCTLTYVYIENPDCEIITKSGNSSGYVFGSPDKTHICGAEGSTAQAYAEQYNYAFGHEWGEWNVLVEPTCTETGEHTRTCTICGAEETEEMPALGHDLEAEPDDSAEPTCTEDGYELYFCNRCYDFVEIVLPALGHDWGEWEQTQAPTCTGEGEDARTCARCGENETRPVEALGHEYVGVVTEPSCTESGYTTYTCSRCGDWYQDDWTDPLDHDWGAWERTTQPSCTDEGEDTRTCARCGETETRSVEALGHDYVGVVTEPTCTDSGWTTYTCSRCGDWYQDDWTDPLDHNYVSVVTEPSCTEGGFTTWTCSRCGDSYVTDETEALGHAWGEWTTVREATPTEPGSKTRTCSRCGVTEERAICMTGSHYMLWNGHRYQLFELPMTWDEAGAFCESLGGHLMVISSENEQLIAEALLDVGNQHYYWLGGERQSDDSWAWISLGRFNGGGELTPFGYQNWADGQPDNAQDTEGGEDVLMMYRDWIDTFGKWNDLNRNGTCGDSPDYGTQYMGFFCEWDPDALPAEPHNEHDWQISSRVEPTCTDDGEAVWVCAFCGLQYTETLPATDHDYVGVVTEPTCTDGGYTTYTCSRCGDSYQDDWTDPLDHDYVGVTTEPTCTEGGWTTYTCSRCGDWYQDDWTEPLDHDYVGVTTEPTCTDGGYTTYTCSRCGDSYVDDYTDALGHDYVWTVRTAPTTAATGKATVVCSRCHDRAVLTLPILSDADYTVDGPEPTCTEGTVVSFTWNNTDYGVYSITAELPALGHDWGEWDFTTEPTCTEGGEEIRTCERCGETETRPVEPLGHDYVEEVTEPTCTEGGYTTYTCSRCGDSYQDDWTDPLEHDWGVWQRDIEPSCTEQGEDRRICQRCCEEDRRPVEALGHDYEDGVCVRCGRVDPEGFLAGLTDVSHSAYYWGALCWAVNHEPQIIQGTSDTTFSPKKVCSRAEIVTMLWRAMGCPEPTAENPFDDVSTDAYYYKAVRWAFENDITDGVDDTHFDPDGRCSRAEVVTFLYRAAGSPVVTQTECDFDDVPENAWYREAVLWAVGNGVTDGTSATAFSPNRLCTRAQVVTFLYRYMGEE